MWMKRKRPEVDAKFRRALEQSMLRSALVSVFWAVITVRKSAGGFTLKELAERLSIDKSAVSRWFSGEPNWELNTVADIADALEVDLIIEAVDRRSGRRFSPAGEIVVPLRTATNSSIIVDDSDWDATFASGPAPEIYVA